MDMLILTRRIGESVAIGDQISVTVLAVKGRQVRIGISAPHDMPVHREEVLARIKREKKTTNDNRDDSRDDLLQ